jgi:hypothetical protein
MGKWAWLIAAFAVFAASCGSGKNDFDSENTIQRTINTGVAETLTLLSGAAVTFPTASYAEDTVVMVSDELTSEDSYATFFPTAAQDIDDLLGALVINTPVDKVIGADLPIRFAVLPDLTAEPNAEYAVYRFDFDNNTWQRWGGITVATDSTDGFADGVIPANGFRGFIGSLAIFSGLTTDVLPVAEQTTVSGTVADATGAPLATDIGVYIAVGGVRYPVAVLNGRIPDGGTVANTVDSAANGTFMIEMLDRTVGQLVAVIAGLEDPVYKAQENVDVLAPAEFAEDVKTFVLRYGENNIDHYPVHEGADG